MGASSKGTIHRMKHLVLSLYSGFHNIKKCYGGWGHSRKLNPNERRKQTANKEIIIKIWLLIKNKVYLLYKSSRFFTAI
jgi:hypothetical protein